MFGLVAVILTLAAVSFARPQSPWNRHGYQLIPISHYPGVRNVHTVIPYQYQPYSYYNAYPSPYTAIIPHQMPNAPGAAVKETNHLIAKPYVFLAHCKKIKDILPYVWSLQDTNSDGKVTWYEWSSTIHHFNDQEFQDKLEALVPSDISNQFDDTNDDNDDNKFPDVPVYNKLAFDISDDNNDNTLYYQEYLNAFDALLDLQVFGEADKNRDLLIDQAEWNESTGSDTPFEIESSIFDINHDGFFSFVEYRGILGAVFTGDICV